MIYTKKRGMKKKKGRRGFIQVLVYICKRIYTSFGLYLQVLHAVT